MLQLNRFADILVTLALLMSCLGLFSWTQLDDRHVLSGMVEIGNSRVMSNE